MTTELVKAVVDDGFVLFVGDAEVGSITRADDKWWVRVNGTGTVGSPPGFYSLEAAEYRALSVVTEQLHRRTINDERAA